MPGLRRGWISRSRIMPCCIDPFSGPTRPRFRTHHDETPTLRTAEESKSAEFENLKRTIHGKLVDKLDLTRVGELEGDVLRREIRLVVEHLCDTEDTLLNRNERERLVDEVLDETFGLGPLELLLKDSYDQRYPDQRSQEYLCRTRGKMEKTTVSSATTTT